MSNLNLEVGRLYQFSKYAIELRNDLRYRIQSFVRTHHFNLVEFEDVKNEIFLVIDAVEHYESDGTSALWNAYKILMDNQILTLHVMSDERDLINILE